MSDEEPRESRLAGRRILITGAASGIGRATAELFAREGARLALFDRDDAGLKAVAAATGGIAMAVDVTSQRDVERAVMRSAGELDGLDGVVSAAGVFTYTSFEETTPEIWHRHLSVNLTGPYLVCRSALPFLKQSIGSTIVNIASVAALLPSRNMTAYLASKGGLVAFTKGLAAEIAPVVRANIICPGMVITRMTRGNYADLDQARAVAKGKAALQRAGEPEEIAAIALFLSSRDSSFMTGSVVSADGGRAYY